MALQSQQASGALVKSALSIKLYLLTGSSSLFPHILLRHSKLDFEPVVLKLADLSGDLFRKINDKGQVPVLQVGDQTITEDPALAFAIHTLAPNALLFGSTQEEHFRVAEWLSFIAGPLHAQAWSPFIRPFRFTTEVDNPSSLACIKEAARQKCVLRFTDLEDKLDAEGPFALGSSFTAVDAYVLPFYRLADRLLGIEMPTLFPKWTKLVDHLKTQRPVAEALEFEEMHS